MPRIITILLMQSDVKRGSIESYFIYSTFLIDDRLHEMKKKNFYMIWNDAKAMLKGKIVLPSKSIVYRNTACLESIFKHHPNAQVQIYSNTLPLNYVKLFTDEGYKIVVKRFDLKKMAKNTPVEGRLPKSKKWQKEPYWIVNVSDLLRLLILFKRGGVYMDFSDTLLLKNINKFKNAIGWEHHGKLASGVMIFEKKHPFMKACLKEFFKSYNGEKWGSQGPELTTFIFCRTSITYDFDQPTATFYPIFWHRSDLFFITNFKRKKDIIQFIDKNTYILHYYGTSQQHEKKKIKSNSILGHYIKRNKIF